MNKMELVFNIQDYARRNHMGVGKLKLKDRTNLKILGNQKAVDLIRIKNGKILGIKGFRGEFAPLNAAMYLDKIKKFAINSKLANKAWVNAFDTIV